MSRRGGCRYNPRMDTLQSYDELPYERLPFPETEPDFLAALAHLHGFEARGARNARVLELGCAQGGNLIPMAARYPGGEYVGVDLSRVQVEEGRAFIARAGLGNIRLLHGDIAALPPDLGNFDYIIAHGVYSWVPDSVREALLTGCRRLLRPAGIAYVSFNVAAGWRTYGQLRERLLKNDDPGLSPMQRVEQARSVLVATTFDDERLQKEADYLLQASASYVFHEYLSDINLAFSFEQFVADAAAHGLRYLGEAGPRRARVALENDWGLSAEARYARWLEAEAGLDEALNTRFRRALMVRDDAPLPQPQQAAQLDGLAFSADLGSEDELDFAAASEQQFVARTGERFPVSQPLLKAFLVVLAGAYPEAASYGTALRRALELAREYGFAGEADEEFREALLDMVQLQGVRLHTCRTPPPATQAGTPQVCPLARLQASSAGWAVTNVHHTALDIDDWGRFLLAAADGKSPPEMLAQRLLARLGEAGIEAEAGAALQLTKDYLEFFRRQGLLR